MEGFPLQVKTTAMHHRPILLFSVLLSATAVAQGDVPNAGFEEWNGGEPVGWTTNNGGAPGTVVFPESPGHTGATALRGQVVEFAGSGYGPLMESVDASGQGFPVDFAYERFRFYYKLQLNSTVGVEAFNANVLFTDANGGPTAAGSLNLFLNANTAVWTFADVPVLGIAQGTERAKITFMLGGTGAAPGSYFIVEDVSLGFMAAIDEDTAPASWGVPFPQPAVQQVHLPFTVRGSTPVRIAMLDAWARAVGVHDMGTLAPGSYKEVWSLNGLVAGTYFAVLSTVHGNSPMRVVVGR
jgi:hypothetical protein